MNNVRGLGTDPRRRASLARRIEPLLVLALAMLLLSSACASRPEIVATVPPPIAGGAIAKGPDEQRAAQPGIAPPSGQLEAPPGSPSSEEPGAASMREKADKERLAGRPGDAGAAPLPPGTERIPPPPAPPREEPTTRVAELAGKEGPLKDIFFDFDRAEIRSEARTTLDEDLRWLKAHPKATIAIEGHCDERGSSEYNLGLGQRRAKVTRDYLVASGMDGRRVTTVSYGKERPFVLGHDESAWRWNRRAHFVITRE
ncbi:MAG: peptidoglycan-associated lipoprotein Pal [Candidatus Methylomirabilaceae bacterium]